MLGISPRNPRAHFLDNLRSILVAVLVFQHSAVNVINRTYLDESRPPPSSLAPLLVFNEVNTHFLWVSFFLVSGWAARLALGARTDFHYLRKRAVKTVLPAVLYLSVGRWFITRLLQDLGIDIFASPNPEWTAFAQLSGPGPYVVFLAILEIVHLSMRLIAGKFPRISVVRVYSACPGSEGVKFAITFLLTYIGITIITFLNVQHYTFIPSAFYLMHPGDVPGYGAPFTLIVAYLAGVHSHFVKKHLLIKGPWVAWSGLITTVLFAYHPSPILDFIAGAYKDAPADIINAITSSIYYPFVGFTLPIALFSVAFSTPYTRVRWNGWANHASPVAYIHLVPVAHNIYLLDRYDLLTSPVLKALVVGAGALIESWVLVRVVAKLWPVVRTD